MKPYKAVFLDFYGTLTAGDADAVDRACSRIIEDHRLPITHQELAIAWGERFFDCIERSNHEHFQNLFECECISLIETLQRLGFHVDPAPYVNVLSAYWRAPALQSDVATTLENLSTPICCVSNADRSDILAAIELHRLKFDALITSEDTRCYKPAAGIFEHAMEVMRVKPSEVVHVGDSVHSDVEGASHLGIDTVWVCRDRRIHDVGTFSPTYKVRSLNELHAICSNSTLR